MSPDVETNPCIGCPYRDRDVAVVSAFEGRILVDLNAFTCVIDGKTVRLPGQWMRLLGALARTPSRVVAHERLALALRSRDESNADGLLKVHVCRLRRVLKPFGFEIRPAWGFGYGLFAAPEGEVVTPRRATGAAHQASVPAS